MNASIILEHLKSGMEEELLQRILPFWKTGMIDSEHGGFFGRIDGTGKVIRSAPKGLILNARILWSFSAAFHRYPDPTTLIAAKRAFAYIRQHFIDREHGGGYWMVDAQGNPADTRKHVYAQSFLIYGLSEFYRVSADREALDLAVSLYRLVEQRAYDPATRGYVEAFDRNWLPLDDARLGDSDAPEKRSFNTHLHLLEACASLYRVWPDEALRLSLQRLIDLHCREMYNARDARFIAFFDENWVPRSEVHSFGHDIESAWLLLDAAETAGTPAQINRARTIALDVAYATRREGIDPVQGGLFNNGVHGVPRDTDKHWWAQAEGIVGYLNAYALNGDAAFLQTAAGLWEFIRTRMLDRKNGEWFWRVDRHGIPNTTEDIAGPWKCPYHTSRACLETARRVEQLLQMAVPVAAP